MKTLSLRAWLTLWYTITLVLVLALFGGDVLIEQQRLGTGRADQELDSVHATLATIFRAELRELDAPDLAAREAKDAMRSLGDGIVILDASNRPLATQLDRLTLAAVMPPAIDARRHDGRFRIRRMARALAQRHDQRRPLYPCRRTTADGSRA